MDYHKQSDFGRKETIEAWSLSRRLWKMVGHEPVSNKLDCVPQTNSLVRSELSGLCQRDTVKSRWIGLEMSLS